MGSSGEVEGLRSASEAYTEYRPHSQIPRSVAGHPRWWVRGPTLRRPVAAPVPHKRLAVAVQDYQPLRAEARNPHLRDRAQAPGKSVAACGPHG